ncbi:hypothetical protein CapIbe_021912 [Capra ibex]
MNSESKVRRCAQGAEKGALAWGVRLAPLGTGERDNTLPPLGIPFLWGHAQSSERSRYPRQAVATSNTGDFLPPKPWYSLRDTLEKRGVRRCVYEEFVGVCVRECRCKNTSPFKGLWSVCRCDSGGRPKCALLEPGGARIKVCLKCPRGRSCPQDLRPWYPECWLQRFGIFTRYLGESPRIDVISLAAGALRVSE